MHEGSIAWAETWPAWCSRGKLVGQHPILVVKVSDTEMLVAVCASDPQDDSLSVDITETLHPSAFMPGGILRHTSRVFIKSKSGACMAWFPLSSTHLIFNQGQESEHRVGLRKIRLMKREEFEDIQTKIRALVRRP